MPLPAWIVAAIVSTALNVIAYIITPRPKTPKPDAVQQAETPTAEAGRPMAKLWGSARISETNVIGWWDKSSRQYQVKVS